MRKKWQFEYKSIRGPLCAACFVSSGSFSPSLRAPILVSFFSLYLCFWLFTAYYQKARKQSKFETSLPCPSTHHAHSKVHKHTHTHSKFNLTTVDKAFDGFLIDFVSSSSSFKWKLCNRQENWDGSCLSGVTESHHEIDRFLHNVGELLTLRTRSTDSKIINENIDFCYIVGCPVWRNDDGKHDKN